MNALYDLLERAWVKASSLILPIASSIVWPNLVGHAGALVSLLLGVIMCIHHMKKIDNENVDRKIKQLQLENLEREAAHQRRKEDQQDEIK